MKTPEEVSLHLVKVLRDAAAKLDGDAHRIDHATLVLGVADMLAELIGLTPEAGRKEAMEQALHRVISLSQTGGSLLVMHKPPTTEH